MDSETVIPMQFEPFNWLSDAKIYNQKGNIVPPNWLELHADVVVLLFTSKGVDREGIVQKFYGIYERIKIHNVAVEVIYIPFDETEEGYKESYAEQANWFTLQFDDPLVQILKYAYGITCIPHMIVIKPDCTVISSHGLLDLEIYAKNAIVTWLSPGASTKNRRRMSKDAPMYGTTWKYATGEVVQKIMKLKFSESSEYTSTGSTFPK